MSKTLGEIRSINIQKKKISPQKRIIFCVNSIEIDNHPFLINEFSAVIRTHSLISNFNNTKLLFNIISTMGSAVIKPADANCLHGVVIESNGSADKYGRIRKSNVATIVNKYVTKCVFNKKQLSKTAPETPQILCK